MANKDILKEEYLNHSKLSERRKFAMADISGRGEDVAIEINWNKLVDRKGYIKINIGDREAVVSREHLYAILFILGSAAEQEKMISPFIKKTQVTKYFKLIGVTATQDIAKGELLNVPLEFTLNPKTHQVIIGKGSAGVIERAISRKNNNQNG